MGSAIFGKILNHWERRAGLRTCKYAPL